LYIGIFLVGQLNFLSASLFKHQLDAPTGGSTPGFLSPETLFYFKLSFFFSIIQLLGQFVGVINSKA
jgi:hypothetical protein